MYKIILNNCGFFLDWLIFILATFMSKKKKNSCILGPQIQNVGSATEYNLFYIIKFGTLCLEKK